MHLHVLTINETTGVVSNTATGDVLSELVMINGDTNLINAHVVRNVSSETPVDSNLTAATALRCSIESSRREGVGADLWGFQDVINQGFDAALTEDLATGFVTWAMALNDSDLTTALSTTEESVAGFIEWTYVDTNGHPKTIAQLAVTIFAQLDDGASGTPPPSSPTYYTASEMDTLIATIDQVPPTYLEMARRVGLVKRLGYFIYPTGSGTTSATLTGTGYISYLYETVSGSTSPGTDAGGYFQTFDTGTSTNDEATWGISHYYYHTLPTANFFYTTRFGLGDGGGLAKNVIDTPDTPAAHSITLIVAVGGSTVLTVTNDTGITYTAEPTLSGVTHTLGCTGTPTATQYFAALAYLLNQLDDVSAVANGESSVIITADAIATSTYDIAVTGTAISGGHFATTATAGAAAVNAANVRFFAGLSKYGTYNNTIDSDDYNNHHLGITFSTARPDTNFQFLTRKASVGQTLTDTGVAPDASKIYDLEIEFSLDGAAVRMRLSEVDGTILKADTAITTNLPLATSALDPTMGIRTLTTAAVGFRFYRAEMWI